MYGAQNVDEPLKNRAYGPSCPFVPADMESIEVVSTVIGVWSVFNGLLLRLTQMDGNLEALKEGMLIIERKRREIWVFVREWGREQGWIGCLLCM